MPFDESRLTIEEYMAFLISREVRDKTITGVGTLSPIPLLGALLAKKTNAMNAKLIVLGDDDSALVDGSKELFDLAQKGKLDLFFLSGAQIDERGNINLTCIGEYERPRVRLPGGAGSAMLYYMAKRTILFTLSHSTRVFVKSVDFITSRGSDDYVWRSGGLSKVISPLCILTYNYEEETLELESLHPGVKEGEVIENTGFPLKIDTYIHSPLPDDETIRILRKDVIPACSHIYPLFVQKLQEKISSPQ